MASTLSSRRVTATCMTDFASSDVMNPIARPYFALFDTTGSQRSHPAQGIRGSEPFSKTWGSSEQFLSIDALTSLDET